MQHHAALSAKQFASFAQQLTVQQRFFSGSSIISKMRQAASFHLDPPVQRGMTISTFDRRAFDRQIRLLAARVPSNEVSSFRKAFETAVLNLPRVSSILDDPEEKDTRLILLKEGDLASLPDDVRTNLASRRIRTVPHNLTIGYDYWSTRQVLHAILPEELLDDSPSAITQIGHIAHLNLREEYLPYKELIGQIILDKNTAVETVVNKIDSIENEFRFFPMEVLAGKQDFDVELSESGCRFHFDFSKVYWNSRLSTEHARLVQAFRSDDVIADGFAGVGPFAIPAAKKGCLGVFANDLNPASASALRNNVKLNKVDKTVRCENMDGGAFFRQAVVDAYKNPFRKPIKPNNKRAAVAKSAGNATQATAQPHAAAVLPPELGHFIDHFVMNLPATAIDLLGCFQGIYAPLRREESADGISFLFRLRAYSAAKQSVDAPHLPMIHCYCFSKAEEAYEADLNERASRSLGYDVSRATVQHYNISLVRSVAPRKDMYRLSFRLPGAVAFGDQWSQVQQEWLDHR